MDQDVGGRRRVEKLRALPPVAMEQMEPSRPAVTRRRLCSPPDLPGSVSLSEGALCFHCQDVVDEERIRAMVQEQLQESWAEVRKLREEVDEMKMREMREDRPCSVASLQNDSRKSFDGLEHQNSLKKMRGLSKRELFKDDSYSDDDLDDGEWVKVPGNAYGAFIHVALQSGLVSAAVKTGPMVVISLLIQLVFAEELISHHISTLQEKHVRRVEMICWVPVKLQISALLIFLTLMFHNIPSMVNTTRLATFCTHHKGGDGNLVGDRSIENANHDLDTVHAIKISGVKRLIIFIAAVLTEIVSWCAILMAGTLWASTAETVDLVIRSTVSVMFVLNIDEIIFESCCPTSVKEDVEETEYRLPNVYNWMTPTVQHYVSHYYGVYGHMLLLLTCSSVTIFVLRISFMGCTHHSVFQAAHVKDLAPWPGGLPSHNFPHP